MIKILRLSTGEDVIGDVIDQGTEIVKVKNAFAIIPMQGGPGQPTKLAFTLYAPYTDDKEIELKTPNVINQTTPKKELQNSYNHIAKKRRLSIPILRRSMLISLISMLSSYRRISMNLVILRRMCVV